jgi:bacteriorhodopsin
MTIKWLYYIILMGAFYSLYHVGDLSYDSGKRRAALVPAIFLWVATLIILYRLFYLGERQ